MEKAESTRGEDAEEESARDDAEVGTELATTTLSEEELLEGLVSTSELPTEA
jgi:hypothetical protein